MAGTDTSALRSADTARRDMSEAAFGEADGYDPGVDGKQVTDRQLEALLARLDRLVEELARLNRRQESREELTVIAHELRNLNESLQALAYAALGQQGPQVRRRRTG
jgi:hypothetical protein